MYPGYKLSDLFESTPDEIQVLIAGLEWVRKFEQLGDSMISPKDKRKIRLPKVVDYWYGPPRKKGEDKNVRHLNEGKDMRA